MLKRACKFRAGFSLALFIGGSSLFGAEPTSPIPDHVRVAQLREDLESVPPINEPVQPQNSLSQATTPQYQSGAVFSDTDFFQIQIGEYAGENTGVRDGYQSIEGRGGIFGDGGHSVFFLDGRLLLNNFSDPGANLGIGAKQFLSGHNIVFGANVFYDHWNTGDASFDQIGAGVELLGNDWELRSNAYAPVGTRRRQIGPSIGNVVGNDIFATRRYQASLAGFDLEYGETIYTGENSRLKAFAGTYYLDGNGVDNGFGVRGRADLALGDSVNLNVSVQNDSIFDTTAMFGAEFIFPGQNRYSGGFAQSVYNRMTQRVHRESNISVARYSETRNTGLDAFFVQQSGTGPGTLASPYSLSDLSADPNFNAGDVAFLTNFGGPIVGSLVIDDPNQQLIGSPDASGSATTVLPDGTILTQSGLGDRVTVDGQVMFNVAGKASGFDIASTTLVPFMVDGLGMGDVVTIDSVNINGSVDDGINIQNSDGAEVQFLAGTNGGLIQDVLGDGIDAGGDVDVLIDNVTFLNVGQQGIRTNYTGTFTGTGLTTITNPGENGIFLTNNVSTFNFEDLTINGGGNGLYLGGFTGDFTVTGDAIFNQQVSTAILQPAAAAGNVNNLSFGTLTIDQENGYAVALEDHQGSFTVDGAAIIESTETLPVALGILSTDSSTDFSFGSLTVNNSGTALALIDHTGDFTVDETLSIQTYRILGIQSEDSTTDFNLGSLKVTDTTHQGGTAVALIDHSGDFEVSGSAVIDGARILGLQVSGGATNFDFGSLTVSNIDGIGVALEGNTGNFIVQDAGVFNNNSGGGFLARAGSSGDYSFGSLSMTHVPQYGYGVTLDGHSGSFTVTGDADFNSTGQWGIQARNTNTTFQFGSLDVVGTSIYGVALDNHTGDFTVDGDVNFTDPWQYGMLSHDSTSDIRFGSLTTSNTAQYAVALDDHTGSFTVDGATNLMNVGNFGVLSTPGTNGDLQFGSLDISGANLVGLSVEGGNGNVIVDGDTSIDGGNFGTQILNRTGDVSFGSLTAANNRTIGAVFSNITGELNVTNDFVATNVGQGWYVDKGVEISNVSGPVNFGSLAVDGNGALGLDYRNNGGGLSILGTTTHDGFESTGFINGISAIDNSGDMTFGDVSVTGTGGYGTGMYVSRNNGSVIINGDATFTNTGLAGAEISDITGNVGFGNLTVETTSQNGLFAKNISGDLTVTGDIHMTNPGKFGVFMENIGGNASATNIDIDGATDAGIQITDGPGQLTVTGNTVIENSHQGIALNNTTTDLSLGNLTIQNTTGNGLSLYQSTSNVTVTGDAVFNSTGSSAILSDGSSSGDFQFANLDIDTNDAAGVSLNGHDGNFSVTGLADFDGAGGISFLSQGGSTGDYSFGSLEAAGNWTANVSLTNHTGDFTVAGLANLEGGGTNAFISQSNSSGDYSFGSLEVSGIWGNNVALVNHSGDFTVTGDTTMTGGVIGFQVDGGTGDVNFEDLTLMSPQSNGISLFGGDKNFTASGVTTVSTPGQNGVIINQTTGTVDFTELNITTPGTNGISMILFDGDLIVQDGEISGIGSGQQAVFKHDSGSGTVTLENMIFSSEANDVFGLVTLEFGDGGAATLNNNQAIFANGSTGTIGYRLGSFNDSNPVDLSGTGNTTINAVEATQFDTFAPSFNGQVEIDGILVP